MRGASTLTTSPDAVVNASVGSILSSITAVLTSMAISIMTNEYISEKKIWYIRFRYWFDVKIFFYEETLKKCLVDKKLD